MRNKILICLQNKIYTLTIGLFCWFSLSIQLCGDWAQVGSDINGEAAIDNSGISVSLSSDGYVFAIGAYLNDGNGSNSGHVRVYEYNPASGAWTQVGSDIDGQSANDNSGISVSLSSDGSIVAIGAHNNDGNGSNSGHVRVYQYNSEAWEQVGSDIDGEAVDDNSGISVSLNSDGSVVAIGADGNDGNGSNSGHVRVYQYNPASWTWTQVGPDIDGEMVDDNSGRAVSLSADGSVVAIGADGNDGNGADSGHARVYQNNSGAWTQVGSDIDGEAVNDNFGRAISLSSDGTFVAIGADGNDGNGSNSGHVRIYQSNSGIWTQVGSDIDGEAVDDNSGRAVSLSSDGSVVAIGAQYNDGISGGDSGHVRLLVIQNDPPILADAAGIMFFTENAGATAIDGDLSVVDVDDTELESATITITSGYVVDEDVLGFTTQNGIIGNWNSASGVMTLSGTSSKANYETALESVSYDNTSNDPNTSARTIT